MNDKKVSKVGKVSKVSKEWPRRAFDTSGTFGTFGTSILGFTLVELLVSMTILGILTTLGLGNYLNSQMKGRDAQRKSDLRQIQNSLELYYGDKGGYPTADGSGRIMACPTEPTALPCEWGIGRFMDTGDKTLYLKKIPADPKAYTYCYRVSADGSRYQVFAHLENSNDPDRNPSIGSNCCGGSDGICNFGVKSPNTTLIQNL